MIHNHEVPGSIPGPATKPKGFKIRQLGGFHSWLSFFVFRAFARHLHTATSKGWKWMKKGRIQFIIVLLSYLLPLQDPQPPSMKYRSFFFTDSRNLKVCQAVNPFIQTSRLWQYEIISWLDTYHYLRGKEQSRKVRHWDYFQGYCSTKNMYYFGLKLHAVAFRRKGTIPFSEMLILSAADENDSTVFKRECVGNLNNRDMPIKYIRIYHSIKRHKNPKSSSYLLL